MADPKKDGMQGEGNKAADRRYREAATQFEEQGRVEPAAEEAKQEVEEAETDRDAPPERRPS